MSFLERIVALSGVVCFSLSLSAQMGVYRSRSLENIQYLHKTTQEFDSLVSQQQPIYCFAKQETDSIHAFYGLKITNMTQLLPTVEYMRLQSTPGNVSDSFTTELSRIDSLLSVPKPDYERMWGVFRHLQLFGQMEFPDQFSFYYISDFANDEINSFEYPSFEQLSSGVFADHIAFTPRGTRYFQGILAKGNEITKKEAYEANIFLKEVDAVILHQLETDF